MSYCILDDVRALVPRETLDGSSTPSSTQVGTFIVDVAAEIDSVLKARDLTVPVTEPTDFVTHLKRVNAHGAAAHAMMGMYPAPAGPAGSTHGQALWSMYQQMLKALRNDPLPYDTHMDGPGPKSMHSENVEEPRETEQWRVPGFRKNMVF